jgi:hypothetical protein
MGIRISCSLTHDKRIAFLDRHVNCCEGKQRPTLYVQHSLRHVVTLNLGLPKGRVTSGNGIERAQYSFARQIARTMNADWHRASIEYAMTNVALVTKVDAVIAALSASSSAG